MGWLNSFERKLRWLAIPDLTLYLVIGQGIVYLLSLTRPEEVIYNVMLIPALVLQGQVWRLLTFVFLPPSSHPVFIVFALYLFYLMGTALENYWGAARYTLFLLIGYFATVAVSFLSPQYPSSNVFLGTSVFLAFATLNPDFELALFFILPVKIKWLALLTWVFYGYQVLFGDWLTRWLVGASVVNYLVFFGRDILLAMRTRRWRMERKAQEFARQNKPLHTCTTCGVTDKEHPEIAFRYCTKCAGTPCYCEAHLKSHTHLTETKDAAAL